MREIKFRAWDKERKEMRMVQFMDWSDWWVSTGHTWERNNALEYGERNSFKNENTDRHILMQFTGMKTNDTDIYEGDIVQFKSTYCSEKIIEAVVKFNPLIGSFVFEMGNDEGFWKYDASIRNLDVVGNIYENR